MPAPAVKVKPGRQKAVPSFPHRIFYRHSPRCSAQALRHSAHHSLQPCCALPVLPKCVHHGFQPHCHSTDLPRVAFYRLKAGTVSRYSVNVSRGAMPCIIPASGRRLTGTVGGNIAPCECGPGASRNNAGSERLPEQPVRCFSGKMRGLATPSSGMALILKTSKAPPGLAEGRLCLL